MLKYSEIEPLLNNLRHIHAKCYTNKPDIDHKYHSTDTYIKYQWVDDHFYPQNESHIENIDADHFRIKDPELYEQYQTWQNHMLNQLQQWHFDPIQCYQFKLMFTAKIIDAQPYIHECCFTDYLKAHQLKQVFVINYVNHLGLSRHQIQTLCNLMHDSWSYHMLHYHNQQRDQYCIMIYPQNINFDQLKPIHQYHIPDQEIRLLGIYPVDYFDYQTYHQLDLPTLVEPINHLVPSSQVKSKLAFTYLQDRQLPLIMLLDTAPTLKYQDFIKSQRVINIINQQD